MSPNGSGLFSPAPSLDLARSPETEIALDLVRRGLPLAPVVLAVGALVAGVDGTLSATYAIALVLGNFLLSAFLIAGAARISLTLVMAAVLFGYLARLGIITAAVLLVKDLGWVHLPVLGLTLIVTHLGLLFWETRFVSASLAFPTLKPPPSAKPATPAPTVPADIKE